MEVKVTSKVFWAFCNVNITVERSKPMKMTPIAPVLASWVHFTAISDTISYKKYQEVIKNA